MSRALRSAVYVGTIAHRRHGTPPHAFRYPQSMLYLDLTELPGALDVHPLWSARKRNLAYFRRADYLGDADTPLAHAVRDLVAERAGARPEGPIRLLTNLRTFGHCFNPVSFYYCFARDGERLEAVVAEVTNTPWGERHAYVLDVPEPAGAGEVVRDSFTKELHVSPFLGMDHTYEWRLDVPGDRLVARIENRRAGETVFDATLSLERRELNRAALTRVLVRYPAPTLRATARIYGQAARLKLKGAKYFPHPDRTATS